MAEIFVFLGEGRYPEDFKTVPYVTCVYDEARCDSPSKHDCPEKPDGHMQEYRPPSLTHVPPL